MADSTINDEDTWDSEDGRASPEPKRRRLAPRQGSEEDEGDDFDLGEDDFPDIQPERRTRFICHLCGDIELSSRKEMSLHCISRPHKRAVMVAERKEVQGTVEKELQKGMEKLDDAAKEKKRAKIVKRLIKGEEDAVAETEKELEAQRTTYDKLDKDSRKARKALSRVIPDHPMAKPPEKLTADDIQKEQTDMEPLQAEWGAEHAVVINTLIAADKAVNIQIQQVEAAQRRVAEAKNRLYWVLLATGSVEKPEEKRKRKAERRKEEEARQAKLAALPAAKREAKKEKRYKRMREGRKRKTEKLSPAEIEKRKAKFQAKKIRRQARQELQA
mmetsp:Transcript_66470/g.177295  ORF Transcript_66470/g.177295 Transcript_66470/m.177295 type:complete len:330 (+) Transcript_66470:224-1213(+)